MSAFRSDEIMAYDPGGNSVWFQLGYGCPSFGDDPQTLNSSIAYLVSSLGRNLSAVMHHRDADLRVPPSINTLIRVHKLVVRGRTILASRAVPENKPNFEAVHATPAREDFLIFPCPIFRVRSMWLKEWAGLTMNAISEACQHTENAKEYEISTSFAGLIGQYLQRIYVRMATELFQVPLVDAEKSDFTLSEQHFNSYNPSKFFTSTELIDIVPSLDMMPTEDDLRLVTDGIPASQIVGMRPWPGSMAAAIKVAAASAPTATASMNTSFVSPPAP